MLSGIIYGSRTARLVGFTTALVGARLGLLTGTVSAYFGGRIDLAVQRVLDVFLSFPLIILALAVVAILGTGTDKVILSIIVPMVPRAGARLPVQCSRHPRDGLRGGRAGGRTRTRTHRAPAHAAERDGALPHDADGLPGRGDSARGLPVVPGPRRPGAHPGVGPHASGRRPHGSAIGWWPPAVHSGSFSGW